MFASPTLVLPTFLVVAGLAAQPAPGDSEPVTPIDRGLSSDLPADVPAPPEPAEPEQTPEQRAQAQFETGKQAFLVGDFDRAIVAFEEAYNLSQVSDLLYNISLSYLRRYEVSHQRSDLDRARVVAQNLRDELSQDPEADLSGADQLLAEISRKMDEVEAANKVEPPQQPPPEQAQTPVDDTTVCPEPEVLPTGDRKRRVGGSVTMGLGGGLLAGGAASVAYFALKGREFKSTLVDLQNQHDADGCATSSSARCEAIDASIETTIANGRQANILAGTLGAGLMTLGAAGLVTGAILYDRGKPPTTRAKLRLSPTVRGVVLTGRF